MANNRLMFDYTYRGAPGARLSGVAWGDPKSELSFFSLLFRRPRFQPNAVEFYDGKRWLLVSGLPATHEQGASN